MPTPIFIEPVNGFGADVSITATVPNGVTAQLDFAQGSAPFKWNGLLIIENKN